MSLLLAPPRVLAPVTITLDARDLAYGRELGEKRWRESYHPGTSSNGTGFDPVVVGLDPLANDQASALREVAAARILRRPLPCAPPGHRYPDLPPDIEVRGTARLHGSLIVRTRDVRSRRFVLVIGSEPTYTLVGWLIGWQAERDEWLRDPGRLESSWFAPDLCLCRALDELIGEES